MKMYEIFVNILFPQELKYSTQRMIENCSKYCTGENSSFYNKNGKLSKSSSSKIEKAVQQKRFLVPRNRNSS